MGTLGAAYAEAGRFEAAAATARKARELALQLGQQELADQNQNLLKLFPADKLSAMQPRYLPANPKSATHEDERLPLQILAQLDVPVGEVDEVLPAIVLVEAEIDLHERPPLRPLGLADEMHPGLLRRAIGLVRIALDARADNILPRGGSATVARDDVVEIQILAIENVAAVLAHVFVALKNIVPRELHFLLWHAIEHYEQDDAGNANAEGNGLDRFRVRFAQGKIEPLGEIIGAKRAVFRGQNSLGLALEQQGKRATSRADIHRLPQTV